MKTTFPVEKLKLTLDIFQIFENSKLTLDIIGFVKMEFTLDIFDFLTSYPFQQKARASPVFPLKKPESESVDSVTFSKSH